MTAIWLLSTKGRPAECQDTLDACVESGMTSPGCVYVDETVDDYQDIKLPRNWTIHYARQWGSLQASLQWCLKRYPDATAYGWLADDVRPRTPGWDTLLEREAGDWCLSYARDLWLSEAENTRLELEEGSNISSGLCWGGKLVRAVGWWALPGVRQAFIDVAWCRIVQPLNLARYTPDVTVEHLNYRTGKRERDAVDDWTRKGVDYIQADIDTGYAWLSSEDFVDTIRRIAPTARMVPPSDRNIAVAVQRLRDAYANTHWKPGMSAAALVRAIEAFNQSGRGERLAQLLHTHADPQPAGVAA